MIAANRKYIFFDDAFKQKNYKSTATALLLLWCFPAFAATDADFIPAARKHFLADHGKSFAKTAKRFSKNSVYRPLLDYWSAVITLRRNDPSLLEFFLQETQSDYLRAAAKRQLLENYLNKKNTVAFARLAHEGPPCAVLLAALAQPQTADKALIVWDEDKKMTDPLCMRLYRQMFARGIISEEFLWDKIRLIAGERRLAATKRLLAAFPGRIRYSAVRKVVRRAPAHLRGKHPLSTRVNRELVMISAMVAARRNPSLAIARWRQFSRYFSPHENEKVWTKIAEWAIRWRLPKTLALFQLAGDAKYHDNSARAWRVRAALREGDFGEVLRVTEAMPKEQRMISAWRYWRAFALLKNGDADKANKMIHSLAEEEDDFYGLLAREKSKIPLVHKSRILDNGAPTTDDFLLALAVFESGEAELARRIWRHTAAREDIRQDDLLAAARLARDKEWHLASIHAAEKIKGAHDLRFPQPFGDKIKNRAFQFGLDTALVFALIRQESRFMSAIRSSAGARGLMQVMPATARLVARKHKYNRYNLSRLTRPDTNIIIGTTYLADLVKLLKGDTAAIAASYNAGPSRVRKWKKAAIKNRDRLLTQLIFIETIPILETRLYVKHVLANRAHYDAELGLGNRQPYDWLFRPAGNF